MAKDVERFRAAERRLWASVGVSPTERRVQLRSGESVRVQEVGEGPLILFVHGASNGGASWASLIARLDGLHCVALDRPGCGLSDPVRGGAGLGALDAVEVFADSLIRDVLDALGMPSANVVATSYGGYFAFRGAAAHPDRVDRIVEFSWPVGAPMAKVPFPMRVSSVPGLGAAMARIPPTRGSIRMLLRQIGLKHALETGRFTDEMLDWFHSLLRDTDSLRNELRSTPRVITPIGGMNERLLLPPSLVASIRAPVQFVWGADDPNGGEDVAKAFAAQFQNAGLEVLEGAGHAPWIDYPKEAAALTRAFVMN